MKTPTPKRGVFTDIPETDYHQRPELSSTRARDLLKAPAIYQHNLKHKRHSAAFDVGTAAHSLILGVGAGVVVYPDEHLTASGAVSTKAATVAWAEEQRQAGYTPISPREYDDVMGMAESVLTHPTARRLLENGNPEVTVLADDPDTGVAMRARFDYLSADHTRAADLKTTRGSASPTEFTRSVAQYGYHIQEAWYTDALRFATGNTTSPEMTFIVVEKNAPYLTAVHKLDSEYRAIGEHRAEQARRIYKHCMDTWEWPGYPTDTHTLEPPAWLSYEFENELDGNGEITV